VRNRFADLDSSRRNARLILQYWKENAAKIENYLSVPPVILFAGHMIDRPDRSVPRFPPELESEVAKVIRAKINALKPGFGFAPAACGSDILFLEAMLEAGAEVTVVLPYNKEQFLHDSVDFLSNSNWRARFDRVLERASKCVIEPTQRLELGGVSYDFGKELLLGLATIHAQRLETSLIPLVVWDGKAGDGPGGTASTVEHWRALGYKPEIINLDKIRPESRGSARSANERGATVLAEKEEGFHSRIVAILFADAVQFSKLTEQEVPRFVQHLVGAIAKLSDKLGDKVLAKNTWGDGIYFVFSDVDVAGRFALELVDLVRKTKWEEKGLPADLNLRIALHAGPVYEFNDPITEKKTYGGTHVSRAARIEPITPPGQVYASEAFAALAAVRRASAFICDYVGQTPTAKGYGTLPVYHVRRTM
jgi:class 3 adenylate cyclase